MKAAIPDIRPSRPTFDLEGIPKRYSACNTAEKGRRHLNFFPHETVLHAQVPRIECGMFFRAKRSGDREYL